MSDVVYICFYLFSRFSVIRQTAVVDDVTYLTRCWSCDFFSLLCRQSQSVCSPCVSLMIISWLAVGLNPSFITCVYNCSRRTACFGFSSFIRRRKSTKTTAFIPTKKCWSSKKSNGNNNFVWYEVVVFALYTWKLLFSIDLFGNSLFQLIWLIASKCHQVNLLIFLKMPLLNE